ncbi:Gfo/Idh/MocA family protein [Oceaniglobus roseus]|uniref:Gfo/Idh/MocA family protein n=1 Tax=Oceaniglobus roseus TaxID=1737570 RepID=UPI000C7F0F8D|nr:Gfo/Idh/MocA family oxidoreductase [Kandeliimicrobium roseum]
MTARVALIGLGMVAKTYVDAIANLPDVELAGVYARSEAARLGFLERHALDARSYDSVEEIAADPKIDFAILATPPDARTGIVDTLAEANVPILMEKPVERTLEAARRLVETCEFAGIPLGIMLQHRARPVVAELRHHLDRLGALRMVEVQVPWWRSQSYYDAPGRGTYGRDGGGVLISQAIHTLDLMLSLTGPVAEVTALTATTGFHRMEAEDFVAAGLRFANGAVGTLTATTASFPGRGESIVLHGAAASARLESGTLVLDGQDGSHEEFGAAGTSGAGADPMAFTSDWHGTVIADFAAALREGRAPMVTGRMALDVHALIAALEASGRAGKTVKVERD